MTSERDWIRAVEQSWVVRFPKQHLATFGTTNIAYYVVTEPIYHEMEQGKDEGVIRTGQALAQRVVFLDDDRAKRYRRHGRCHGVSGMV